MKVVWKYPLSRDLTELAEGVIIEAPEEGKILKADIQDACLTLWILVDPDAPKVSRAFRIVGTGHLEVRDPWVYIETHFTGSYVWHLFEVPAEFRPLT